MGASCRSFAERKIVHFKKLFFALFSVFSPEAKKCQNRPKTGHQTLRTAEIPVIAGNAIFALFEKCERGVFYMMIFVVNKIIKISYKFVVCYDANGACPKSTKTPRAASSNFASSPHRLHHVRQKFGKRQ